MKKQQQIESEGAIFWRELRRWCLSTIGRDRDSEEILTVFGFVSREIGDNGFGQVTIDNFADTGEARFIGLPAEWGPFEIKLGQESPHFGDAVLASNRRPGFTDPLVLQVWQRFGRLCVRRWAYQDDWRKAEELIAAAAVKNQPESQITKFARRFQKVPQMGATENKVTATISVPNPQPAPETPAASGLKMKEKPDHNGFKAEAKDLSALNSLAFA